MPGESLEALSARREAIFEQRETISEELAKGVKALDDALAIEPTNYEKQNGLALDQARRHAAEAAEIQGEIDVLLDHRHENSRRQELAAAAFEEKKKLLDDAEELAGKTRDAEQWKDRDNALKELAKREKKLAGESLAKNKDTQNRRAWRLVDAYIAKLKQEVEDERAKVASLRLESDELAAEQKDLVARQRECEKKAEQARKDATLYLRLYNTRKREDLPSDLRKAKLSIELTVLDLKTKLSVLQARTPVDPVANCPGPPHKGKHACPLAGDAVTDHQIHRDELASKLAHELHLYIDAARHSPTMRALLGIKTLTSDSTGLWMIGALSCWDPATSTIKVLYAVSGGTKLKPSGEPDIWCGEVHDFKNFRGDEQSKALLQEDFGNANAWDAETRGQLGNCAAPKLIDRASKSGLVPFEMAEMAFFPTASATHGKLMASCNKCVHGLGFWLCGLKEKQDRHREAYEAARGEALAEPIVEHNRDWLLAATV